MKVWIDAQVSPAIAAWMRDRYAVNAVSARGAGALLFIRDGHLATLEGFTHDEPWPDHPVVLALRDVVPIAPDGDAPASK